ncbi:MAG: YitT family protein [Eubacteriaceae bacterium]
MVLRLKGIFKKIIDYIGIAFGSIIMALAFNSFSVPNKIAPGGFSGLATVIYYFTSFPIGIITLILTLPLFFISIKLLGAKFGIKSFFGTVFFSICIDFIVKTPPLTKDLFLASVFGGLLLGIGMGIIFRFGGTTGGTDLLATLLNSFFTDISIGTWLLIIDFIVVIIAGVAFKQVEIALYSILTIYINMRIIDLIIEGINYAKAFYIISKDYEKIAHTIIDELDRGVTILKGTGMYTKQDTNVIFCIVNRSQIYKMKEIIKSIDINAFVILADVHEVLGEGFKNIDKK